MKKSDGAGMKIQFIGTGAADFDWSEYGKPGVLGSTSTLLDDHVLIDCGPTVPAALARFNADAAEITDIVITHNHSDHFDMESVKKIAGNGKIRLFGSPQVCAEAEVCCEVHPVSYGCRFQVAGFDFLALPANHVVEDPYEDTFLYVISGGGGLCFMRWIPPGFHPGQNVFSEQVTWTASSGMRRCRKQGIGGYLTTAIRLCSG